LCLKGLYNEDISYFIKKVVFTLHPSFANPKRVIEKFPFELIETGWGEFEIGIKIHFVDTNEKPVEMFHSLKLYAIVESQQVNPNQPTQKPKPICSEHYEEVVFNQPREEMYKILMETDPSTMTPRPTKYADYYQVFSEQAELRELHDVQQKLKSEIQKLRDRYETLEAETRMIGESPSSDTIDYSESMFGMAE